jgi:diacylglycerol O-acyltransferase / wax synthase
VADDRLSALDASFLHLEDASAHMHVASVMLFDGDPPSHEELVAAVERRLHLVPRYRQRLAPVPLGQGRPKWVDDPHLNLEYHVRATALPTPGTEEQLRALAGRVFSQPLDRDKPLWELWLAEGLEGGRFALLSKTHHALVDGIQGLDLVTVLFDSSPEPSVPADPGRGWLPRPVPSPAQLLGEALVERTSPREVSRTARALLRAPRGLAAGVRDRAVAAGALSWAGVKPAPPSPYNRPISPHRRFSWVRASLGDFKAIKDSLGGTVNDVVVATVAGALGRHLRRRGIRTDEMELQGLIPLSVEHEENGSRVEAIHAPLPVWCQDPVDRLELVHEELKDLKEEGGAVGAEVISEMGGFAAATIMGQAARAFARRRYFNVVVTNVPGPQNPLYLLGRELVDCFPMIPLARNQGLGVAILSYNRRLNFGLVGDYDVMFDLQDFAEDVMLSLGELAEAANIRLSSTVP